VDSSHPVPVAETRGSRFDLRNPMNHISNIRLEIHSESNDPMAQNTYLKVVSFAAA
jgi:hypothetical protein